MTGQCTAHRQASLLGVLFMAAAMLLIPVVDATAKWLSASHSPWFLGWVRYAAASAFVLPVAAWIHKGAIFPKTHFLSHSLRTVFLVIAMTLYFLAIANVPLSTAVTAYFVGPVLAVGFAIAFLGERLTIVKAGSLVLGFAGAIIVLNPGRDIDIGVVLALGSGVFFALYLVTTRTAAQNQSALKTLAFQCALGSVLLAPQAFFYWSWPNWEELAFFVLMGLVSAVSHALAIAAFVRTEASTLAPLVYLELLSSVYLGWALFGERPTTSVWAGGCMIALAGLLLVRSRQN